MNAIVPRATINTIEAHRALAAASYRFAAAAHRREAAFRRQSPLGFQRDFARVLESWADAADARADQIWAPVQMDLFGADALVERAGGDFQDLPPGAFAEAGTNVNTVIVSLSR